MRSARRALPWALLALVVVATTAPALRDPPYWDANVYVHQARYSAAHGLALAAYRHPPDVLKPPLFASLLLGAAAALDPSPLAMHLVVLALALALLWAERRLVLALGGSELTALVAGALVATAPLFVAQAGLVQSDLPLTLLTTLAWTSHVRARLGGWLVWSTLAVLTKESGYFLCAPALALEWLRAGGALRPTLRRILVPAWPGLVLLGWLGALHLVTGHAVPRLNRDALGPNFLVDALVHELVEGGRLPLVVLALVALRRPLPRRDEALATGVGVLALPLLFFAPLPRYMMPGLPLVAALAALGVTHALAWPAARRALLAGAVVAAQVAGWFGPSWHVGSSLGGHHLDCNLRYRRLLATQRQVVHAVAALRPRAVAAAFPFYFAFSDPPGEGWLPAPLPTVLADAGTPTDALCRADVFVDADQSAPIDEPRARLGPALVPWHSFGEPGLSVRVWRVDCAAAPPRTPPAPPPSRD